MLWSCRAGGPDEHVAVAHESRLEQAYALVDEALYVLHAIALRHLVQLLQQRAVADRLLSEARKSNVSVYNQSTVNLFESFITEIYNVINRYINT